MTRLAIFEQLPRAPALCSLGRCTGRRNFVCGEELHRFTALDGTDSQGRAPSGCFLVSHTSAACVMIHFLQCAPWGSQVLWPVVMHPCAWALSQSDIQLLFSRLLPSLARFYSESAGAIAVPRASQAGLSASPGGGSDSADTPCAVLPDKVS